MVYGLHDEVECRDGVALHGVLCEVCDKDDWHIEAGVSELACCLHAIRSWKLDIEKDEICFLCCLCKVEGALLPPDREAQLVLFLIPFKESLEPLGCTVIVFHD